MSEETPERAPTQGRRDFLVGAAVATAGVAVIGATAVTTAIVADDDTARRTSFVLARRVAKVPLDDPEDSAWSAAGETAFDMDVQIFAQPHRTTAYDGQVYVSAVHDGSTIGFRLEWADSDTDDTTVACDRFRDACAVLLVPPSDDTARVMGTSSNPATLLQWKADWQRDVDEGFQDVESVFPNTVVDFHPPLVSANEPVGVEEYVKANATQWLPALHRGNPIANAARTNPVEKLLARGFGTAATMATQNASGRGVWGDGRWRVVIARPLDASDDGEVALAPGSEYSMTVALWLGSTKDSGGRKSPGKVLLPLRLEA